MGNNRTSKLDSETNEFYTKTSQSFQDLLLGALRGKEHIAPGIMNNPYILQLERNLEKIEDLYPKEESLLSAKRALQYQTLLNTYYGLRRSETTAYNPRLTGNSQQKLGNILEAMIKNLAVVYDFQLKVTDKKQLAPEISKEKRLPLHEKLANEIRDLKVDPSTRDQILFELMISSRKAIEKYNDVKQANPPAATASAEEKKQFQQGLANISKTLEKVELQETLISLSKSLAKSKHESQKELGNFLSEFMYKTLEVDRHTPKSPKA